MLPSLQRQEARTQHRGRLVELPKPMSMHGCEKHWFLDPSLPRPSSASSHTSQTCSPHPVEATAVAKGATQFWAGIKIQFAALRKKRILSQMFDLTETKTENAVKIFVPALSPATVLVPHRAKNLWWHALIASFLCQHSLQLPVPDTYSVPVVPCSCHQKGATGVFRKGAAVDAAAAGRVHQSAHLLT